MKVDEEVRWSVVFFCLSASNSCHVLYNFNTVFSFFFFPAAKFLRSAGVIFFFWLAMCFTWRKDRSRSPGTLLGMLGVLACLLRHLTNN